MRTITNDYKDSQILNLGSGGNAGLICVPKLASRRAIRC